MANMSRRSFLQLFGASAAAVVGLGLVGCGGSSDSGSASKLEAVKKNGKLKAGVKKDVPGYGYLDPATNKYEGLEIDLCYQIAAKVFDVSYDDASPRASSSSPTSRPRPAARSSTTTSSTSSARPTPSPTSASSPGTSRPRTAPTTSACLSRRAPSPTSPASTERSSASRRAPRPRTTSPRC